MLRRSQKCKLKMLPKAVCDLERSIKAKERKEESSGKGMTKPSVHFSAFLLSRSDQLVSSLIYIFATFVTYFRSI